jgi:hypothetical protein
MAQCVGPEFKPQHHKKKKKEANLSIYPSPFILS